MAQPLLSPSSLPAQIPALVGQHTNNTSGKAPKSQKENKPKAELASQYPLEVCGQLVKAFQRLIASLISFNHPPISLATALRSSKTSRRNTMLSYEVRALVTPLWGEAHCGLAKPRQDIIITLPDGAERKGTSWETSPLDVAKEISKSLSEKLVIAKVPGPS
jgi:hypothetical protein